VNETVAVLPQVKEHLKMDEEATTAAADEQVTTLSLLYRLVKKCSQHPERK